jgi:hypothetical protein
MIFVVSASFQKILIHRYQKSIIPAKSRLLKKYICLSKQLTEFLNVAATKSGAPGEQLAMIAMKAESDLAVGKKF